MSENEIHDLLTNRVEQLATAAERSRISFGLLAVLSFLYLSAVYLQELGWTRRRLQSIDTYRLAAIRPSSTVPAASPPKTNTMSTDPPSCPCKSPRVERYHPALALSNELLTHQVAAGALPSDCRSAGLSDQQVRACAHTARDDLCLRALNDEYERMLDRLSSQTSVQIPLMGLPMSVSDIGTLGALAALLAVLYFYACSRREKHALNEFLKIERSHNDRRDPEGKRLSHHGFWARLMEPLFAPRHMFLAYQSVAHRFVFVTSSPDYVLHAFTSAVIWAPAASLLLNFFVDLKDYVIWYRPEAKITAIGPEGNILVRLAIHGLFAVIVGLTTFKVSRYQREIYDTLRVWATIMDEKIDRWTRDPTPGKPDEWMIARSKVMVIPGLPHGSCLQNEATAIASGWQKPGTGFGPPIPAE